MSKEQSKRVASPTDESDAVVMPKPKAGFSSDVDDLLGEMDDAMGNLTDLEAEDYVKQYIQKGGQ